MWPLLEPIPYTPFQRCIIDSKQRTFDAESCNVLANMAEMVVREIEKDVMLEQQKLKALETSTQLIRALECFT